MQDKRSMDNGVIEIDLGDIFCELRKNLKLIAGIAVAFAASAAVYSYVIAKPVYQYNVMLRIPANVGNHAYTVNTCLALLKNDGVASVSNISNTSLLKLTFSSNSPVDAKKAADEYVPKAEKKVNDIIKEVDGGSLEKAISMVAKQDTSKIMQEHKVEVIRQEKGMDVPVSPNKKKNIIVATVLGIFVSCSYVIGRFLWRK